MLFQYNCIYIIVSRFYDFGKINTRSYNCFSINEVYMQQNNFSK